MFIARRKQDPYTFVLRASGPVTKTQFITYHEDGTTSTSTDFIADDDAIYLEWYKAKKLFKGRHMIRRGTQIEI